MKKFSFWSLLTVMLFMSSLVFVSCSDDDKSDDSAQGGNKVTNKTYTVKGVQFTMVGVQGGTFQMGSNNGESNEKPVHSVTLSDYYIGQTEVTQALWTAVMGYNNSEDIGDNFPIEWLDWYECQEFITKLNALTGEKFRLPTEAEWEFAARGGNKSKGYTYSGSNNADDVAWYVGTTSSLELHAVGTKKPNELGIYDMSGNVWEWCQDWYGSYSSSAQTNPTGPASGDFRVLRGGGVTNTEEDLRTTNRYYDDPSQDYYLRGFRLAK